MDNKKIFKALEYLWLFSAAIAVVITVYFLAFSADANSRDSATFFFFFFLSSCAMYLIRRYQRKKQEERESFGPPKNKP
jgi:predicted membrane channel-forming protein YqfA (hemolysin III family)